MKIYSPPEAFQAILRYCAYQERSHQEVRDKLYGYGLHRTDVDELLSRLITEGFLNEERFAKAFAGGKFRMMKWGRNKIVHELEAHRVSPRCIRAGLLEIDESDYQATLQALLKKKLSQSKETNPLKKKDKAARFVIGKGYEPMLVWKLVKELDQRVKL